MTHTVHYTVVEEAAPWEVCSVVHFGAPKENLPVRFGLCNIKSIREIRELLPVFVAGILRQANKASELNA